MPGQALHLALTVAHQPVGVLAAEKSKVPFYVAGGALVAWALIVSLALGLRRPAFPSNLTGERTVIAITTVLVAAAVSTAVITSSPPAKAKTSAAAAHHPATGESPPAPSSAPSAPAEAPKASTTAPAVGATGKLKLAANPTGLLSYNTKRLSAKAGSVTIEMTNNSPVEHNVTVARGGTVLGATPTFIKGTKSLTLTLKPGPYTFYCSVPGHRQAGMEGTLSVS